MLHDGFSHAQEDMAVRSLQEARVEAEQLMDATQIALDEDGDGLLNAEEFADIVAAMRHLAENVSGMDYASIRAGTERLNQVTHEFAARRMNARVREALTGQNIDGLMS